MINEPKDLIVECAGEVLRNLRSKRRISLRQLESKIGITRSLLSRYEKGDVSISLNVLERIAKGIDVPAPFIVIECLKRRYPKLREGKTEISAIVNDLSERLLEL